MKKIIIFDGPDKCGKTEMATELSNRIKYPYFKNKSEWDAFEKDPEYFLNALKYGDTYFFNYMRQTNSKVILDRSFPSEWCYSRVFNRPTDEKVLRHVDKLAADAGACIVIPYRTSYAGMHDDVHQIDENQLKLLSSVYEEFAEWTVCKVLRLCVDSEDINYEMNQILTFVMRG
jgi:hypothetical protein